MSRRTAIAAITATALAAATVVLVAPAVTADAAAPAEVSGGVTIPSFYDPPAKLPKANGALIRTQPLKLAVDLGNAKATLLMYKSTDSNGKPVAVTGTYLEPTATWAAGGARPLITFASGTVGQGDQCAPSLGFAHGLSVNGTSISLNYEIPTVYSLLSKGIAVVVTDYVGLGTTDRLHTYVNRLDEGHAVLDAARAATRVPGSSLSAASKVATYGYSQGGGASASAAELQPSYAPDVALVGSYAGAPPADLAKVLAGIDGTALVAAVGWALTGFEQAYPQLKPIVDANANATGKAALAAVTTECVADGIMKFGFTKTSAWTTSGRTLSQLIAQYPVAQQVIDAQRIGTSKPTVPVRVISGTLDDFVDHGQVKTLAADWCARGANVTYQPVVQTIPTFGTGVNHLGPDATDASAAQAWIVDRLTGKPATSNCAALPTLP